MKRYGKLAVVLGLALSMIMCGCEKDTKIVTETSDAIMKEDVKKQLTIIAENKDMWITELEYADEVYRYAISDLDHNGRYEVIVSNMGGTGLYTYSRFFEVNETYDGLVECTTDFMEGD